MKKTASLLAALGLVAVIAAAVPAQAEEHGWGRHQATEQGWRSHEWRQRAWHGHDRHARYWHPRFFGNYGY